MDADRLTGGISTSSALDRLLRMYGQMVLIRDFEDTVNALFLKGAVPGTTHLSQGQEAVAVGIASGMQREDYSTYTYRGHGHALARGLDPVAAFAEILGKSGGVNHGKGGSMHLTDARLGLYGSFAIVGAGMPVAVGLARASQLRRDRRVSVTFFGDGATNIGAFHEAMNLAAVWGAPIVFVCENNLYGEYTHMRFTTPVSELATRAASYAMRSRVVDGNDVQAVYAVGQELIEDARNGEGPSFLECLTYRQKGHSRSDPAKYRPPEEVESWLRRDPLILARRHLTDEMGITEGLLNEIEGSTKDKIEKAADTAASMAWPSLDEVTTDVVG